MTEKRQISKRMKDMRSSQRFSMSLAAVQKAMGRSRINFTFAPIFWSFSDVFFFEITGTKTCMGLGKRKGGEMDILFVNKSLMAIKSDIDPKNPEGKKIRPDALISIKKDEKTGLMEIGVGPEGQMMIDITGLHKKSWKTLAQVAAEAQTAVRKANIETKKKNQ